MAKYGVSNAWLWASDGCGHQWPWTSSCCGPEVAVDVKRLWTSTGCGPPVFNWLKNLPQMIVSLMKQWSPSAWHSQLSANTMNLGGYTGYGPHCTVGAVTKYPPFCSCENVYFGHPIETKFSVRPPWYQHCFHHASQQSCMN